MRRATLAKSFFTGGSSAFGHAHTTTTTQQQMRLVGHDQFVNAASLQKIFAETRDKSVLADAKRFFETQTLEGVEKLGDKVADVMNAVVAFRPSITASQGITTIFEYMLTDEALSNISVEAASRVMHAGVVLHIPQVFDVLMFWLWEIEKNVDELSPTALATVINAYGRAGVKHSKLYEALLSRAKSKFNAPPPPITHIANVVHALSKVGQRDEALMEILTKHIVTRKREAVPLVVATILDAYAQLRIFPKPNNLFRELSATAQVQLAEYTPPLMASIALSAATEFAARNQEARWVLGNVSGKRMDHRNKIQDGNAETLPLLAEIAKRGMTLANIFDANTIAKLMKAFRLANYRHEDLFGCLAERACHIVSEFHLVEIRDVLQSLAHFDLYDGELFPLMANKAAQTCRTANSFPIAELAEIVRAFAHVKERNDDFLKSIIPALRHSLQSIQDGPLIDLLFSFATFGIRSEIVSKFLHQRYRLRDESKLDYETELKFIEKQFPNVPHKEPAAPAGQQGQRRLQSQAPSPPARNASPATADATVRGENKDNEAPPSASTKKRSDRRKEAKKPDPVFERAASKLAPKRSARSVLKEDMEDL